MDWWAILLMFLGTFAVLGLFHVMFGKMVKKHTARIRNYEQKLQNPLRFFDLKSYLIMAFMIALGITLRVSGVVPNWFIAFFYTGLGSALVIAGLGFILHRIHGSQWSFHKGAPHKETA